MPDAWMRAPLCPYPCTMLQLRARLPCRCVLYTDRRLLLPRPHASFLSGKVAKRRKRARPGGDRAIRVSTPGRPNFLASLEGQGMVRVALTPDEVNSDIAVILQGLDSVRTNGAARPAAERPTDIVGRNADKIHSSRGTLHYHDISYEKADKVSIFACNKPNTPKYSGTIMSVNSKEIHICASDSTCPRIDSLRRAFSVFCSCLRRHSSNRFRLLSALVSATFPCAPRQINPTAYMSRICGMGAY